MSMAERTGGTRERILVLLRRHGRLSAPQLADLLELTPVGVRRHLALLERDGLVTARIEKPKRGRPTAVYRLTDAGLETFPRHYDELAREALAFVKRHDASLLSQFLAWRNERLAASYAKRVDRATLSERAEALADVLSEQGFMAEVEPAPGGLRLCQHNCTVEHLATELPDLCASEAKLFERLLGSPVEREATIVDGGVRCVTHVQMDGRGKDTGIKQMRSKRRSTPSPTHMPARSEA
ncbi:MAG TPA: metalloregulator ArsR/SmtB family transcription factor [Actinomycetes bacterium]|jgi:predicted ArsR family transcriptional regulator|nr:metalloregulator ArsR/SmtB family transcription factor [Actinomycetes bacterium]